MPPLLVGERDANYVGEGGLLLGLARSHPHIETVRFPPGGIALLFTDGLVEDRRIFLDANLERLRAVALEAHDRDVEAFANHVMSVFGVSEDDVAMIVLRRIG